MQNIPAKISYQTIWNLAVQLAGRTPDNVPPAEETMLQAFFAAELPDLWNKEAWPELCDNLRQVTLTGGAFSKNLGTVNEIGDVLGVYTLDPRQTPGWSRFPSNRVVEANGQVYVSTNLGAVFVDFELPAPDLLDPSLNEAALMATVLPSRFRLPLAFRGAAHLLSTEDPELANKYLTMAENELARQAAKVQRPYWRTEVRPDACVSGQFSQSSGSSGAGITSQLGVAPIASGVSGGSVTGLGLNFTPSGVLLTVIAPDGSSEDLFATGNTVTNDGFNYVLNGLTDKAGYKLVYNIFQ